MDIFNSDGTVNKNTEKAVSKTSKPGWNNPCDFGNLGEYKLIPKKYLCVDSSYQRYQSDPKVNKIAANFCWLYFGVLIVSMRSTTKYFVLDGGHRFVASVLRDGDIENLPCLVLRNLTKAEEARIFVYLNKNRKAMSGLELYAAQVVSRDPATVAVEKIICKHGLRVGNTNEKDSIGSPQALLSIYEKGLLELTMDFIDSVWPKEKEKTLGSVLKAVSAMVCILKNNGMDNLQSEEIRRYYRKVSLVVLLQRANAYRHMFSISQVDGMIMALKEFWNKGHKDKLPMEKETEKGEGK